MCPLSESKKSADHGVDWAPPSLYVRERRVRTGKDTRIEKETRIQKETQAERNVRRERSTNEGIKIEKTCTPCTRE